MATAGRLIASYGCHARWLRFVKRGPKEVSFGRYAASGARSPSKWVRCQVVASKKAASSREELLQKLRERISGFAASRLQRDAAEDLAQEVLILLHQKYEASRTPGRSCSRCRCKS